jgi:hypothetical protein
VSESFEIFYCLCFVLRCLVAEKEREYARKSGNFFWVFVFCLV